MKKIMVAVLSIFVITACSEVKSVEWYKEHPDEMKSVLMKCELKQGSSQDQNCLNAKEAKGKSYMDKMLGGWQGREIKE